MVTMQYESFISAQSTFLWLTFAIALVMGAVVNKTNFCTMGAVSDWVNMGDRRRFRAWLLAIAVAVLGVVVLEFLGLVSVDSTFPPYRGTQLIWVENLIGGLMFGVGMTLASGCGNKTLVRLGAGNLKSLFVFLVIAVIAYFMVNPFPGTDKTLFGLLFYGWMRPLAVDLGGSQDLGAMLASGETLSTVRLVAGAVIGVGLLLLVFKSADFRRSGDNILGGLVVGLAVLAAWYVSSNIAVDVDGEPYTMQAYVQEWDFLAESEQGKPADSRPLASQSFTFINPMGQSVGYAASGLNRSYLTFGIMALFGVIAGSFLWSVVTRSFRVEWFASLKDFVTHLFGAVLMGFGGVLALGCTIGQAITGISTLAAGSFIAFAGIVLGSALTMKVQYYKLVYEQDASFAAALITSLVDLHLLPEKMRKLDAV